MSLCLCVYVCPLSCLTGGGAASGAGLGLPRLSLLDLVSINVVLLSNYSSFGALPFITEKSAFRGAVIATEPTAALGEQCLLNVEEQARLKFGTQFSYSHFEVLRCCERIQRVSFGNALLSAARLRLTATAGQYVSLLDDGQCGVTASPSGFCLGACNWTLSLWGRALFVLSDCSIGGSRHSLPIDATPLLKAHAVVRASCR
jgi:Cft2 family RNA processing exonuclease